MGRIRWQASAHLCTVPRNWTRFVPSVRCGTSVRRQPPEVPVRHRGLYFPVVLSVLGAVAAALAPLGSAGAVIPLKNAAIIDRTNSGYRYQAGQQDSHLVITRVSGGLRFVDT